MVLPIWLWLVICVIIFAVAGAMWLKKVIMTDPKSARAAASGTAIPNAKLDAHCRSMVARHEITAPGKTTFVGLIAPLEFVGEGLRARTPISLVLSEQTVGIAYNKGALGNVGTVLVNRRDITDDTASDGDRGFPYTIKTSHPRTFTIHLQSADDQRQLAAWVTARPS